MPGHNRPGNDVIEYSMSTIEKFTLHLINAGMLVFVCAALGFLAGYLTGSLAAPFLALAGLLLGFILWWRLRQKLLRLLLGNWIYQLALDCVYMVGIFGFFMGVPVFNILPGILAADIVALNARLEKTPPVQFKQQFQRTRRVTLLILFVFLVASAAIALLDPYTGANLQGMLGLSAEVTRWQIIAIILFGGAGLMLAQWFLQSLVARWSLSKAA